MTAQILEKMLDHPSNSEQQQPLRTRLFRTALTSCMKVPALFLRTPPKWAEYVDLGAGAAQAPGSTQDNGYVRTDVAVSARFLLQGKLNGQWIFDACKKWPCPDNRFQGIFSSHMIEHIPYKSGIACLKEAYRCLKPGGTLRIIFPTYKAYFPEDTDLAQHLNSEQLALDLSRLTQCHGHVSVWNGQLMQQALTEIGFTDVKIEVFGSGRDPKLLIDFPGKAPTSEVVEASKPS